MKKFTILSDFAKALFLLEFEKKWHVKTNLLHAAFLKGLIITLILGNLFASKEINGQITYTQTNDDDFKKGYQENVVVSGGKVYLDAKATSPTAWLSTTILPQSLTRHQIAVYQSFAYLVGGNNGTSYSSNVYRSTLSNSGVGAWTLQNNLPEPLIDHQVVTGVNYLYVLGGKNQANQISNKIYYSLLNVSGAIGNWTLSTVSLPETLWGMKAICINGFLYVSGGSNNANLNSATNRVYFSKIGIDGRLSEFVETTALPEARNGHTIAAYDSKLFVIGGFNNSGTIVNSVYYAEVNLDGTCSNWQNATNLPDNICNHATTSANGLITVMGGDNGTGLLKTTYYANLNDYPTFTWTLSPNELYDYVKCGQAMTYNGRISFAGGENLSGMPLQNTRYNVTNQNTFKVNSGCFVSFPFTQLGDVRNIERIAYNVTYAAPNSYEMFYRLAGNNGLWGDWVNCGITNPQLIGQQAQYLQYMVRFRSTNANNVDFNDLTLTISGSQLSGSLNAIDTLRIENSPYLVTGNITFTAGNHVIEPGVTILFSPNTGLEIGQANLKCNGTVTDSIKFTSYNFTPGEWNGVYFNDNSDNGVSSQFSYTIIEKAGFGTWDANLYCYNTTEPAIENCSFRKAVGYGVSLYNADLSLESVQCKQNDHGLLLRNSDPSMIDVDLLSNIGSGLYYYDETSFPNFTSCLSENNGYGVYVPTPDRSFQTFNAGMQVVNNGSYYGVAGGGIRYQRTWEYFEDGYTILGNIIVYSNSYNTTNHARLTLTAGTTLRFAPGVQLQIGYYQNSYPYPYYGGELYAEGTEESPIIFTSLNGTIGGWNGLYFENASDAYGATSSLKHCILENGNSYNMYCENTLQPSLLENCIFRNSAGFGIRFNVAGNNTLNNCEISNTISDGIFSQSSSGLKFNNCLINNVMRDGIELESSSVPDLINCTISNIQGKGILLNGSQNSDIIGCTIQACDTAVYIFNSATCKLQNTLIQNNNNGMWSNNYVEMYNSSITNTAYPGFPVWANFMYAFPLLVNSTIEDNNTPITIGGSPLYYSRYWPYFEQGYQVIANAQIYSASSNTTNHTRLTIASGNTIRFAPGVQLQIGYYQNSYPYPYFGGELFAEGTEESPIIFTSLNGVIGGWNGIYFENASDYSNATSSLKHCIIEKGNDYNVYCENTNQPSFTRTLIKNSKTYGIKCYEASPIISSSFIINNLSNGIYLQNNSQPTLGNSICTTNDIYGNGVYDLYNNTNKNINARYNHWNSNDPAFVGARIFDKADNTSLGTVFYEPISATSLTNIPELLVQNMIITQVNCFGNSTGAINITPAGGIPPYSFLWSNQATTEDISNLIAGNYTLTITDSRGCATVKIFAITQPTQIALTTSGTNVSCPDCYDGTVSVIATGGTESGDYSYLWDDPQAQTSATAVGLGVGTYTVLVTDDNGCTKSASFTIIDITGHSVTGNIHYYNSVSTNLSNTFVFLENTVNGAYFSSLTDIYGSFIFPGIPDGNYALNASPTVWGGVNATDALLILKHPAPPLTGLKLEAGDVNGSGYVNASDATLVLQRSVHLINSFPSGNWYFETTEVGVEGGNVDIDFDGICYGDVNGSFNPPYLSDEQNILLEYKAENVPFINESNFLTLPVKINRNVEVSAMTLNIVFNDKFFTPNEIIFAEGMQNTWNTTDGNKIHLAWCNLNPISFENEDILLEIKFEIINPNFLTAKYIINIENNSEFADVDGNIIQGIMLIIPDLFGFRPTDESKINHQETITSIENQNSDDIISTIKSKNVPNPFTEKTEISYSLPVSGRIKLSVFDIYGQEVSCIIDQIQNKGDYNMIFDAEGLSPGIYFYQISLNGTQVSSQKMVLTK